jgi:hypothetical protein
MTSSIVINVRQVPEVLFELRVELAKLLREAAQDELPAVAMRLKEIASAFEVGSAD